MKFFMPVSVISFLAIAACVSKESCKTGDPGCQVEPVYGFCERNDGEFPVRPENNDAPTLPFLRVEGTRILDESGNPIALRGMNFGSWMMMETWIAGIGLKDEGQILDEMPVKAGDYGVNDLFMEAQQQNVIEWFAEDKSHWVLVQEWREYMQDNAGEAQKSGVEQFWAWFDSEPWIFEERTLWKYLAKRFGFNKAEELRAVFQDNYITELDVQRVSELGLNLIRVPIWYDALETDYAGENYFKKEGWDRLDKIGRWARKHKVYLMLDLHGAPGGQNTSWHQGLEDGGQLWTNQKCVDKTARLWKAIANYFRGDPHIAVYDLLNEPMNVPDKETYATVHDAIYMAIRSVDQKHIVMIEDAYLPPSMIPAPGEMGWKNAMFSIHLYPGGNSADDYLEKIEKGITKLKNSLDYYKRFDCPLFLGEFNAADGKDSGKWAAEGMDKTLEMLNRRGVHWAPWTWKYYSGGTIWGLYHPKQNSGYRVDVKEAGFEKIRADFEAMNSLNFEPDAGYEEAVKKHSKAEFKTLDLDVETQPEEPVYWSAELTKVKDDIVFIEVDGKPFFAIGFDTHKRGPWDGVTGPNGCYKDENGVIHGQLDNAAEMTQQAVEAGANFAFQWSYTEEISSTEPRIYGRWTDGWGISMPKENDFIPIMVNGFGESDMDGKPKEKIEQMKKEFEDFKNRTGNWSPEKKPNLPPYEEIPWFAWHPTWRMRGGGDGTGELLTDELAETFAKTTNMMIGDNYTYVCNKHDSFLNPVTGQCGEKDECYDDWLAKDDECHQSYFSAAWSLAHSIRQKSNPDAVIWMWLQGHAFDDDIGISECWNGYSTLWAKGPFPAMRYLRKEITSTIAAGGTGIIFFGYLYNRENTAEKLRSLMRTLAHPEVYEPALTSPRLDLGFDLTDIGEGGRVHVISKWHDATKTAYIIGANPGAYLTEFTIEFPWTISKAELLDWFAPKFTASGKLGVNGRKLSYEAPLDDGFIIRVTPLFKGN